MAKRQTIPPRYRKAFCNRIRDARDSAGYGQADMAAALGLERDRYKQYESRSLMPHHYIPTFCRLTGHHPWFILTGEPPSHSPGVTTAKRLLLDDIRHAADGDEQDYVDDDDMIA